MSDIYLKIGVLAGSHINATIKQALDLAAKLDISVEFSFNGISVFVTPSMIVEEVIATYEKDLSRLDRRYA